jgi:hypothetical protein
VTLRLAILLLESELAGEKEIWELVVRKARTWLSGLATVGGADIEVLEKMAREAQAGISVVQRMIPGSCGFVLMPAER